MTIIALLFFVALNAQQNPGKFIADQKTGCQVWVKNGYRNADSLTISWSGGCRNNKADGQGKLTWYIANKQVSKYSGWMKAGDPNGKGKYEFQGGVISEGNFKDGALDGYGKLSFPGGNKLEGNFKDGEIFDLDADCLTNVHKYIVSNTDSTDIYLGDDNSKELGYYIIVPKTTIKAVLVLLPGTWERIEYVLSSNKALCSLAFKSGIAVITASVNQRLTLNQDVLDFLNAVFTDAVKKYQLPKRNFIIGGFSMGGLFSTRYTEMAYADSSKTAIIPRAAYSVDGPTDLDNHYREFERAAIRNTKSAEPPYALAELRKYTGGTPDEVRDRYIYYSAFSKGEKDGGNAKYLKNVPIRIYNDVDVSWWLSNRGADLYDMNALDQSAMINFLHGIGNRRAEFINAFGKGYRLEGNRHPHSWSIVDAKECVQWIMKAMNN